LPAGDRRRLIAPTDPNVAAHKPAQEVSPLSSLDRSALLVPGGDYVALTLYPSAGEATAVYVPRRDDHPDYGSQEREKRAPELVELDSARRARGELRRQIRRNRGRYLWTFTYARATYDYLAVAADVGAFLVAFRAKYGRQWIVLVPEPHPGGHGWHVHAATNRTYDQGEMWGLWGHGFVWVGDHNKRRGKWAARDLAGYLAKYVTKVIDSSTLHGCQPRPKGHHRYWVTQGFEPECIRKQFRTFAAAALWVLKHYGAWDEEFNLAEFEDLPVEGFSWRFPDRCLRKRLLDV
jgi:hypothetical protein